MTLQQLVYFLAVAETRHFTRAAQRAHVAQPSLSKQIQSLETELGASLFTRSRGNVALTAAGEALLPVAKRILSDVDTARLEVAELVGLRRGRIRLGATPSVCVGVLADVLRRYHDRYPGVRLLVEEGGSRDLTAALLGGELDLALVIVPPQGIGSALTMTPVLREQLMVASSAAEPAPTDRDTIRLETLRDHRLVMFRQGYDLRETTLHACREAGFEPRLAVEGGEMDAVLRFVEAGLGVAVVPSLVLPGRPGLRATPLAGPSIRRTIALAHRTDAPPTAAARAFRSTLLGHIDGLVAANALPPGVEPLR
ncbi:LysR substrate-binding domain-containing protein [Actinokineospora auranticolor]|uniref:DNA-binding transcriptional LysR family regulator n=1 Tax=Actinokineospora auranticolor TaxID=155976 RepID=A0A2S6GGE3_9PSEU|nr:LysR substrate-binding domain-containing protein [Actinokineospora auranticolor]PPK64282.1 DNA-binding transcriptional LysR family regulator [Actinokineospora auranticolor]